MSDRSLEVDNLEPPFSSSFGASEAGEMSGLEQWMRRWSDQHELVQLVDDGQENRRLLLESEPGRRRGTVDCIIH